MRDDSEIAPRIYMLKDFIVLSLPAILTLVSGGQYKVAGPKYKPTVVVPSTPATPSTPAPAPAGTIFRSNGTLDPTAYTDYATTWNSSVVDARLGPSFATLNPNAVDNRPTNYLPSSKQCTTSYIRVNPYELGIAGCSPDSDFWSDSGQVAYVPDDTVNDPGLDRIQTFAYYDNVFAISPRLDWASTRPHPEWQTQEPNYKAMLGFFPRQPVGMVRNYSMLQNEALVIYRDGLLGCAGTQTSREDYERPFPGLLFPSNKVPTAIAITSSNEFALVTIWDTQAQKGQLAVIALEAKFLPFHTWKYMAMSNQGSWSDFKLLGYIDLPMVAPNAIAAASNGFWKGPSQTAGQVLSQIDLTDAGVRWGLLNGEYGWASLVASKGYAVISSKMENKVAIVDLTPLFAYVRDSYLSSEANFQNTISTRGSGPGQWPLTFAEKASIAPKVVWSSTIASPTAVLAGLQSDRWSPDRFKAYVASEDGTIHILDTSSLMARWDWEPVGQLAEIGSVKVGRNPVSMCFTRFLEYPLPLIPNDSSGKPRQADPLNNTFYVACRGDREIDAVVTFNGQGMVYRRIQDSRMGDPVAVSVASRGNILSVADYNGKKILSFRIGAMVDRQGRVYGCGASGNDPYEFAGELPFAGKPIALNSVNVN